MPHVWIFSMLLFVLCVCLQCFGISNFDYADDCGDLKLDNSFLLLGVPSFRQIFNLQLFWP